MRKENFAKFSKRIFCKIDFCPIWRGIELLQAENNKKILCFEVEHIGFVRLHYNAPLRSDSGVIFVSPPERSDFHSANQSVVYRNGTA